MRILQFFILASLVVACNTNPSTEKSEDQPAQQSLENDPGVNSEIENKKWILVELDGQPIEDPEKNPAYFVMDSVEKKINGQLGCNSFFGTYKIEKNQKISFSEMGTTMMACPDMNTEDYLKKAFHETDNFILKDGILYLRWRRAKNLAGFRMEKPQ